MSGHLPEISLTNLNILLYFGAPENCMTLGKMHDIPAILHDSHAFRECHAKLISPPGAHVTYSGNATTVPGSGNMTRRQVLTHSWHATNIQLRFLDDLGFLHDIPTCHASVMHFHKSVMQKNNLQTCDPAQSEWFRTESGVNCLRSPISGLIGSATRPVASARAFRRYSSVQP